MPISLEMIRGTPILQKIYIMPGEGCMKSKRNNNRKDKFKRGIMILRMQFIKLAEQLMKQNKKRNSSKSTIETYFSRRILLVLVKKCMMIISLKRITAF